MSEFSVHMTFGEQWRAIKAGDVGTIMATLIELAILFASVAIIIAALTA